MSQCQSPRGKRDFSQRTASSAFSIGRLDTLPGMQCLGRSKTLPSPKTSISPFRLISSSGIVDPAADILTQAFPASASRAADLSNCQSASLALSWQCWNRGDDGEISARKGSPSALALSPRDHVTLSTRLAASAMDTESLSDEVTTLGQARHILLQAAPRNPSSRQLSPTALSFDEHWLERLNSIEAQHAQADSSRRASNEQSPERSFNISPVPNFYDTHKQDQLTSKHAWAGGDPSGDEGCFTSPYRQNTPLLHPLHNAWLGGDDDGELRVATQPSPTWMSLDPELFLIQTQLPDSDTWAMHDLDWFGGVDTLLSPQTAVLPRVARSRAAPSRFKRASSSTLPPLGDFPAPKARGSPEMAATDCDGPLDAESSTDSDDEARAASPELASGAGWRGLATRAVGQGRRRVSELTATELQVVRARNRVLAHRNRAKVRAARETLRGRLQTLDHANAALRREAQQQRARLTAMQGQASPDALAAARWTCRQVL